MKRRVILAPAAIKNIETIHASPLRSFGRVTADRSISKLLGHLESFELFPERGRRFDDLRQGLRLVGFRRMATMPSA